MLFRSTVFRITSDGKLTSLFSFQGSDGSDPESGLMEASDGSLYGTTYSGGAYRSQYFPGGFGTVFRLTVPRADSPRIILAEKSGSAVKLTWLALPSRSYQLQFTTNLAQPNWRDAGTPLLATGTTATAADAVGSDRQRFYRVALFP